MDYKLSSCHPTPKTQPRLLPSVTLTVTVLLLVSLIDAVEHPHDSTYPRTEDKKFWYSQAKKQLDEVILSLKTSQGVAKNVILFVGDGMGMSTITAARILKGQRLRQSGEEYQLVFEKFPHVALTKTYNINSQIGGSSACSTALMCGVKANINTVGLDHRGIFEDCNSSFVGKASSIFDWAQSMGKSTGIVTNTRLTHGTPSALYAHSASRYWEDDSKMPMSEKVRCKDIARQLVEDDPGRNIQVLLGGGYRHWISEKVVDKEMKNERGRRTDDKNLVDDWLKDKKKRGLHAAFVSNKQQFNKIKALRTDFLLGIFSFSHMDFEVDRDKTETGDPSLVEMTIKAIHILQRNPKGFFLVVESGRIDHAHHHNMARRALEEVDVLDEAISETLAIVPPKDSLVLVTADHSHVLAFGGENTPRGHPITGFDSEVSDVDLKPYTTLLYGNGPGYAQASVMERKNLSGINPNDINYAQQAAVPKKYETHGGEDVPIYAIGPGSYLFTGTVEQSYIPHAIAYATCMDKENGHCEKPPSDDACATASKPLPVKPQYPTYTIEEPPPEPPDPAPVEERKKPRDQWQAWNEGVTIYINNSLFKVLILQYLCKGYIYVFFNL